MREVVAKMSVPGICSSIHAVPNLQQDHAEVFGHSACPYALPQGTGQIPGVGH